MISGIGPLPYAANRNHSFVPARSYPLSVGGTSIHLRYHTASSGASLRFLTTLQLLSSSSASSPCGRSPAWQRHSSAGSCVNARRREATALMGGFAVLGGSLWAATGSAAMQI